MSATHRGWLALVALALLGAVFAAPARLHADEPAEPPATVEVGAQVLTRVLADGRIEFCLQPTVGHVVCPEQRFLPAGQPGANRWLNSSEVSWVVPVDPERVLRSASAPPPVSSELEPCTPDLARMLATAWQVETGSARGTAFYIGEGRFLTAYHVIEDDPPFVTLRHADRRVAAFVLGSDPVLDVALLEVADLELVRDVPAIELRAPTAADVGDDVFLVGYPGGGALALSRGGFIRRVWDNELQTTVPSRGGGSGGPLIDACGRALGVFWGGTPSLRYGHAGEPLHETVAGLDRERAALPAGLPSALLGPGRLVWHFGAAPPSNVDCSRVDGELWVGLAGRELTLDLPTALGDGGWRVAGSCGREWTRVVALAAATDEDEPVPGACIGALGADAEDLTTSVLHETSEPFGEARLVTLRPAAGCSGDFTHALRVDLAQDLLDARVSLIGRDGTRIEGTRAGRWQVGPQSNEVLWQSWTAPYDFEAVAFRVMTESEEWTVDLAPPESEVPTITMAARITIRVDPETAAVRACLRLDGSGERRCPPGAETPTDLAESDGWHRSGTVNWFVELSAETADAVEAQRVGGCAIGEDIGDVGWQLTTMRGAGTATYVGHWQFLVDARLLTEAAPWGAVARGDVVLPIIRLSSDPRNNLALATVIGEPSTEQLGMRPSLARSSDGWEGSRLTMVSYPAGDARRHYVTLLLVDSIDERLITVVPSGAERRGAPLIDSCSGEVVGVSIGGSDVLRAETVRTALADLRLRQYLPAPADEGPMLQGAGAVLGRPVYFGPEQPDFGGTVCDVRPSERYTTLFAVYIGRIDFGDLMQVVDEDREVVSACGGRDKVFLLEFRSDQIPEAVCIEPNEPTSPLTTLDLELDAPEGIVLQQATEFARAACPGYEKDRGRWASTHFVQLRNTGDVDFDDLTVELHDAEGELIETQNFELTDRDPDVMSWRFQVEAGVPAKVVVTADEAEE